MKQRGALSFTLVELMAAMTVLSLLMVALVAMFDQAMRGWRNAQTGIDARREVRAGLQMIDRDLRGMVVGPNAPYFTEGTSNNTKGQEARIYFMTTLPDVAQGSPQGGDLCGVGYYLTWTNIPGETNGKYVLMRYQMEARTLMNRLTNLGTGIATATRTDIFPDTPTNNQVITNEILAMNVAHLQVEPFVWTNGTWDYRTGININTAGGRIVKIYTNRPGFLAVNVGAYGPGPARNFTNQAAWTNTTNVTKHLRTYFWRVVP